MQKYIIIFCALTLHHSRGCFTSKVVEFSASKNVQILHNSIAVSAICQKKTYLSSANVYKQKFAF